MDIVLGVSMTPTTVRMVLVEGEKADGVTVDHDVFDVTSVEGSANVADQVVAAVLGTKESAETGGHHLRSIGVTWSDHAEAAALRDALSAQGIDDVMLVSEGHAAASLAQAVGRAVGYDTTALLFVNRDTATLSVVQTDDGSVVKVLSRTLHSADAMAVLTEMAEAVASQDSPPQGLFVVGSGVDVSSVKAHLEHLVSLPVNAPDDAELALARGAALASAAAPAFEAMTVGLAYSQDPDDGTTAGSAYAGLAAAATEVAPAGEGEVDEFAPTEIRPIEEGRKPFLLVGSALTSVFVLGVVALVISLAVSIRPTADQRPSPAQSAIAPSSQIPAPPKPVQQEAAKPPAPPPAAETIKAPEPVAVEQAPAPQQAPRTVFVEKPAPAPAAHIPAPAPAAPAPAPAPAAPAPAPVPAAPVVPAPPAVAPQQQWPRWSPQPPSYPYEPVQQVPEYPSSPYSPPWQQAPPQPQWPGGGGYYPGGGDNSGGGRGGDYGHGPSRRGNCFLIFCGPGGRG
ncbi:hypothetical protein Mycch_0379 [Mycolicibacterium chubuense NBB4]|uniref:DUF7159 domain-containing protein n=1 Tax=Mycolicibacterium chubuense (strain NBB4) TaxID=710421 RepID=I4BD44_MYCCN|nr:hypothetical protein [Mycolicibacterium chubuense]AFM15201.1 hypothetical protein Mycch_0379 [Mycolicibacterium chubuense NBB4]